MAFEDCFYRDIKVASHSDIQDNEQAAFVIRKLPDVRAEPHDFAVLELGNGEGFEIVDRQVQVFDRVFAAAYVPEQSDGICASERFVGSRSVDDCNKMCVEIWSTISRVLAPKRASSPAPER